MLKRADWRPAILAALLALALYAVTIPGTYIYDDRYIVQHDPRLLDVSRWDEFWTKDYFYGGADNLYRPLVSMSYAIQAKLHGNSEDRAWAFHLVNWLLHAGVSAAVAELARRMTNSSAAALTAGLLFAALPIHVEAVANIVGRAELMCALGMMVALTLFLRPLTIWRTLAIWSCFVLALLSKEQGILLPLLLVAAIPMRVRLMPALSADSAEADADAEPTILPYASPSTQRWRRLGGAALLLLLLMLWTLALYIFFRERILKFWWNRSFLDPMINPIVNSRGVDRWLMPFVLVGRYVALLVAPLRLSYDWGGNVIGARVAWSDPYLYIGLASALAGIIGLIVAILHRAWAAALCLLAPALLFGMVSNALTLIGINFAERLMYIPSAFLCVLAAIGLVRLPRRIAIVALTVVLAAFSLRTVTYAWRWNDRLRLYEMALAEMPGNVRLYMVLAEELARRGDYDRASSVIAEGRDVEPGYYKVWMHSAMIALRAGRLDDAERFVREGHRLQPTVVTRQILADIAQARAATRPATRDASRPAR